MYGKRLPEEILERNLKEYFKNVNNAYENTHLCTIRSFRVEVKSPHLFEKINLQYFKSCFLDEFRRIFGFDISSIFYCFKKERGL